MLRVLPCAFGCAQLRLKHMLMTKAMREGRRWRLKIGHRHDPCPLQPQFHPRAYAVNVLQFERQKHVGQIVECDHDEAIRFSYAAA
jgi:hypothetical protein